MCLFYLAIRANIHNTVWSADLFTHELIFSEQKKINFQTNPIAMEMHHEKIWIGEWPIVC